MARLQRNPRSSAKIDTSVPHPARVYDYWLGGKDHFQADRELGEKIASVAPHIRQSVQDNRAFLRRVVRHLCSVGVSQFLDIGTGIPAGGNTHEVAQAADPAARVVYVDNDPIVMTHARALLRSAPEGRTAYIEADFREPYKILKDPETESTLDFGRPIGLLLLGLLMHVPDADDPWASARLLVDALPSGSHLVVSHVTADFEPEAVGASVASRRSSTDMTPRSRAEIMRFFEGLEMVEPGLVPVFDWRPEPEASPPPERATYLYAGVGRKP